MINNRRVKNDSQKLQLLNFRIKKEKTFVRIPWDFFNLLPLQKETKSAGFQS